MPLDASQVHFQLPKGARGRSSVQSLDPRMLFVQRWLKFMVLPLAYEVRHMHACMHARI